MIFLSLRFCPKLCFQILRWNFGLSKQRSVCTFPSTLQTSMYILSTSFENFLAGRDYFFKTSELYTFETFTPFTKTVTFKKNLSAIHTWHGFQNVLETLKFGKKVTHYNSKAEIKNQHSKIFFPWFCETYIHWRTRTQHSRLKMKKKIVQ